MDGMLKCCCTPDGSGEDCILCAKPLVYFKSEQMRECAICRKEKSANAACEDGHFVCDECHSRGGVTILAHLLQSDEKNPIELFLEIAELRSVHMHGPEHHSIVPCVLLTAYKNNGGDIELAECLEEAWSRGKKIPGGACGFLGVCGAAAGAGIFASIISEATPLSAKVWDIPQRLTLECLSKLVEIGGPRCCKRTVRLAIEAAAEFTKERFGISMPISKPICGYSAKNRECLHEKCPYFAHE